MNCVLGIDTSCYTTSVAILDSEGKLAADTRRILEVKPGGRGLAQSEMVFQHTRNLPELFAEAIGSIGKKINITKIGVSGFPRPVEESYMPAFLVGKGYARVLSDALHIPLHVVSHQENHVMAGIWSARGPRVSDFLVVHISGGTTDILKVHFDRFMDIQMLGTSLDLHAGQFVDRIGVLLGLPFPAGAHLEKLAQTANGKASIPSVVQQYNVSFSGPLTHAERLIAKGEHPADVSAGVQHCIAKTLVKMLSNAINGTGLRDILIVGGVGANTYIRSFLSEKLSRAKVKLYFPEPVFSKDNAVGSAYYAFLK